MNTAMMVLAFILVGGKPTDPRLFNGAESACKAMKGKASLMFEVPAYYVFRQTSKSGNEWMTIKEADLRPERPMRPVVCKVTRRVERDVTLVAP